MDERVAKAVEFLLRNPNASIPESMAAIQLFSREEVSNRSIQQRVRRAYNKKKTTVPSAISAATNSTLSPITNPSVASSHNKNTQHDSTNDADASENLMLLCSVASDISGEGSKKRKHRNSSNLDGVKELRLTSSQAQQNKINEKKIKANNKAAFKEVAPSVQEWTAEDEASLVALETEPISIKETALGRLKEQRKREMMAAFKAMSPEEKAAMMAEMTAGVEVEGKKTEEEGKAEEEEGEEGKI